MKKRQYDFLKLLMEQNSFAPVSFFAEQMQVSEKTLRREIQTLNKELESYSASIITRAGTGIVLDLKHADREKLLTLMTQQKQTYDSFQKTPWEKNTRRLDIALNLLLYSDEFILLSDLAFKYYVSNSSITNDIKALNRFFDKYGLTLNQSKEGTGVSGLETDIRNALVDMIIYILDCSWEQSGFDQGTESGIMMTILECFSEVDLSTVERLLRNLEETVSYYFDEKEYNLISIFLLVTIYRIRAGFSITQKDSLQIKLSSFDSFNPFYKCIQYLVRSIEEQYGVKLHSIEIQSIYEMLAGTHLYHYYSPGSEETDEKISLAFGSDFIDAFSVITEINLREESSLYDNIMSHITLMLNRIKMNASAKNPIITQILKEYSGLINVCQIICWILTKKFHLAEITIDEICYLTLYIQGEIMEKEEKANIVLVSNLQKGLVNLIRHKLLTSHPKWSITVCSYYSYTSLEQSNFDFVISTMALEEKNQKIPYVTVSPLADAKDMENIDAMFQYTRHYQEAWLQKLISLVNDLKDLGCSIRVLPEDMELIPEAVSLKITGQKDIQYIYCLNHIKTNRCHFILNARNQTISKVILNMYSWDFMLFASKLVYLLNNCQEATASDFANILLEEM